MNVADSFLSLALTTFYYMSRTGTEQVGAPRLSANFLHGCEDYIGEPPGTGEMKSDEVVHMLSEASRHFSGWRNGEGFQAFLL
jgi:hypothetical protein